MKNKFTVFAVLACVMLFAVSVSAAANAGNNFEYVETKTFDISEMFRDGNLILNNGDMIIDGYLAEFKNVNTFYKIYDLFITVNSNGSQCIYSEKGELFMEDIPSSTQINVSENVFTLVYNSYNKSRGEFIRLNGKFSIYSNKDGSFIANLSYADYPSAGSDTSPSVYFTNGYYVFKGKDGLCGLLGEDGEVAMKPMYQELSIIKGESYRDKFIAKQYGRCGIVSVEGVALGDFKYTEIHQYGFYTQDSKFKFENKDVRLFAENAGMMTLLDTDFREITEPVEVQYINFISENLFTLRYIFNGSLQTLIMSTDSDIPMMVGGYSAIGPEQCGIAYVEYMYSPKAKYGFIDLTSGDMTAPQYMQITDRGFTENMCGVIDESNGKIYGYYIDTSFNVVIKLPYGYVPYSGFSEGVAAIKNSATSELYFINANGDIVIDGSGKGWRDTTGFSDGYAWVIDGKGKHTLIRYKGDLPSSWAEDEIAGAIEKGLVPEDMQCFYKSNITRAEFARLAVILCAKYEGISEENLLLRYPQQNIFNDTNDKYILCAASMGIIAGRGNGIFDPDSAITREEAAKMLYFTYISSESDISAKNIGLTYADRDKISLWALDSVGFVTASGVMNGVGDNKFDPSGLYTREQAYLTFLRLYDFIK